MRNPPSGPLPPEALAGIQSMFQALEAGMEPKVVADSVFAAIREEKFYIVVGDAELRPLLQRRMEDVLMARNPAAM